MKKIIISFIAISAFSTSLFASSFATLGAGYSKGDNGGDMLTGFGELKVIGDIGVRLEYTKNITEHSELSNEDIARYGLYATYTLPLTDTFSITPKAGLNRTNGKFTVKNTAETLSDDSTNFTYGLELNYNYNSNISFYTGYTDYAGDIKLNNFDASKLDNANYTIGVKMHL